MRKWVQQLCHFPPLWPWNWMKCRVYENDIKRFNLMVAMIMPCFTKKKKKQTNKKRDSEMSRFISFLQSLLIVTLNESQWSKPIQSTEQCKLYNPLIAKIMSSLKEASYIIIILWIQCIANQRESFFEFKLWYKMGIRFIKSTCLNSVSSST